MSSPDPAQPLLRFGSSDPEEVARQFVACINSHDLGRMLDLCSEEPALIDALGRKVRGREAVAQAWRLYFELFPDYRIDLAEVLAAGEVAALFGRAFGTYSRASDPREAWWSIPAAWRVRVANGLVAEWQVYADNKPVYDILAAR